MFLVESRVPHLRVYAQLKHRTTIPQLWWKSFLNLNELWGSPGWAAVNPKSSSQASMWRRAQRERNGKWKSELASVQFKKAHHICCGATSETSRHLNSCQSPSRGKGNNAVQCVKSSMFFFLYFSERHHFLRKQPWKCHLQFSSFFLSSWNIFRPAGNSHFSPLPSLPMQEVDRVYVYFNKKRSLRLILSAVQP